tara:strand:- start:1571 stop:2017 length:447 start_codon:yes stop_codon:yes gene_type:complete
MKYQRLVMFFLIISFFSCEDGSELNPEAFTEFVVDISGEWKISQVTQNGTDITSLLDFQSFSLQFNYENEQPSSYFISDLTLPFILSQANGNWSFDDEAYPTKINFSDGSTIEIEGAVLSNGNALKIKVPLGCNSNTYIYSLIKLKLN